MGHEITAKDVFGEVRAHGKRAWHQLGIEIQPGLTANEALVDVGLDWETELLPIYAAAWNSRDEKLTRIKVAGRKLHVRKDLMNEDPDDVDAQLGVVSDKYKPISNKTMADFADLLCGLDRSITIETMGSLRGGKRVFALVRLPKTIKVTDEDVLVNYVLIVNGHDGLSSFECYLTSVRVVCANTLRMSQGSAKRKTTFAHTGDITAKIEQARKALGIVLTEAEQFETAVFSLRDKDLTAAELLDYIQDAADASFPGNEVKRDEMVGRLYMNMIDPKQTLPGIEHTAWAAYNAVSQYHDHERGRGAVRDRKMTDARVHANLFGVSDKLKQDAFAEALAI